MLYAAVLLSYFPLLAEAASLPVRLDPEVVGVWNCGSINVSISGQGHIDIAGEAGRDGSALASDGRMDIVWDLGGTSEWSYAAGEGALVIATDRGANYACLEER